MKANLEYSFWIDTYQGCLTQDEKKMNINFIEIVKFQITHLRMIWEYVEKNKKNKTLEKDYIIYLGIISVIKKSFPQDIHWIK